MILEKDFPNECEEFNFPLELALSGEELSLNIIVDKDENLAVVQIMFNEIPFNEMLIELPTFASMCHILSAHFKNPPTVVNLNNFNLN